jgi:hypothetical protein
MKAKNSRIEDFIRLAYKYWERNLPRGSDPCPDEETLACFVDDLLNREERDNIIEHLLRCDRCTEKVLLAIKIRC